MTVYMAVTADEYELPLAIADSVSELAGMMHLTTNCVRHRLRDNTWQRSRRRDMTRVIRIDIEEDDHAQASIEKG